MIEKIYSDNTKEEIDKSDDTYILGIDLAKQDEYDYSCVCYMRCNKNGTFTLEKFKGDDYNKLGIPSKAIKL